MHKTDTKDVKRRIRTLLCHLGALQGSYPQVLEDADYARAHLLVLQRVLPHMRYLLRFAADMIPVIEQVAGVAGRGRTQLGHVSRNLRNIDDVAENAVQQILTGLEEVEAELRRAQDSIHQGDDTPQALSAASDKLLDLFSVLQFQDITSQQIEATHALLSQLQSGLHSLCGQLGMEAEDPDITVREGAYDPHANYDPASTERIQQAVDAVVETVRHAADDGASMRRAASSQPDGVKQERTDTLLADES